MIATPKRSIPSQPFNDNDALEVVKARVAAADRMREQHDRATKAAKRRSTFLRTAYLFAVVAGLLLAGWLFSGCASGEMAWPKSRQGEAVQVVLDSYGGGLLAENVPPILWRGPEVMNCAPNADGVFTAWVDSRSGGCVGGLFAESSLLDGPAWIELGWPATVSYLHETELAHELCHWWSLVKSGGGDDTHAGICFMSGGKVDRAVAALVDAGL